VLVEFPFFQNSFAELANNLGLADADLVESVSLEDEITKFFTLELSKDSSDRGPLGIQVMAMRLATRTGIDLEFDITNEGVVATAIREATGDEDIVHVEEEAFDDRTTIHCAEPNVVASYLTPMRKAEILTLMAKCRSCDVHVTQNEVAVTERTTPKSVEALSDRLTAMLACADALDA